MLWLQIVLPGALAALVTSGITPQVIQWAHRLSALDAPGGRKKHRRTIPRLGGVAIVCGIVTSLALGMPLLATEAFGRLSGLEVLGFGLACCLVFGVGLADDIFNLRARQKFAVQFVAAVIVVSLGWRFTALRLPLEGQFQLGMLAPALSVLWIVGVTNAINLIDGLDGLAAGVVAIIGSSLLALAVLQDGPETMVAMSCIVGACLGFLRHNWRPAKIYMGDSGSLILGFLLATISLRSTPSVKASAALAMLVPILALGLPVIDTLLVMWYRFLRGHHKMNRVARMFHADRAHLHHLLVDSRKERRSVMVTLFAMAALFCGMALWVAASDNWRLGLVFLILEIIAVVLVRRSGMKSEARQLADQRIDRWVTEPDVGDDPRKGAVAGKRVAGSPTGGV